MNTDNSAGQYATRCLRDLGQQAHDSERVAIWCYDHPPRKPLPKGHAARERQIWVSRRVWACLRTIAKTVDGSLDTDALADAFLTLCVKEHAPQLWTMFERHDAEQEKILRELRVSEPDLQPQEEA